MKFRIFFSALALLMVAVVPSYASLVTNGGFESGLSGWSCSAPSGACFTGTQGTLSPYEGAAYFYGFDNGTGGTLSQGIATTAGDLYTVSLAYATNGPVPPNTLDLNVGTLAASFTANGNWQTFSSTFKATSALSSLDFFFLTQGGTGTLFIDDVTVNPASAPEPASLALLGVGLLSLAAFRRRRA